MTDERKQEKYAEQISEIVHNFVQLWIKFESMLHEKLLELQNRPDTSDGNSSESFPNTVIELVYRISSCIHLMGNPTMGELSSALSLPFSTATRMIDYLVARGYLQRLSDTTDRRIIRVALTDKGENIHQFIEHCSAERVQQLLSCLTDDERNTLFALINKVALSVKESVN